MAVLLRNQASEEKGERPGAALLVDPQALDRIASETLSAEDRREFLGNGILD